MSIPWKEQRDQAWYQYTSLIGASNQMADRRDRRLLFRCL